MHSIDSAQPEKNHQDLTAEPAIVKVRELIKQAQTCFFCSSLARSSQFSTRPMSVQRVEPDGAILFMAPRDGHLAEEIAKDGAVQLLFQASAHYEFLTIFGRAMLSQDRALIRELWEPILKTWFTEGVDDPRIAIVRVAPESGYYWDTKHGRAVALAKMVAGAVIGKTLDDSMQGSIKI